MEFFKSIRGNDLVLYEDYIYNKDKTSGNNVRWRCQNRKCKGTLITVDNLIIERTPHMHLPEEIKCKKLRLMNNCKTRITTTMQDNQEIISSLIMEADNDVIGDLPSLKSINNLLTKKRNNSIGVFDYKYEDIPEMFKKTLKGENFLIFDSGYTSEHRAIIFLSNYSKEKLLCCKTWLVDGTFKSAPSEFYQLVTIHGAIFGKTYPLVYSAHKKCHNVWVNF
ncbi:hypothetical protein ENBRE01_3368 [Enteropsectra breve]|nr:hypothetical protein ENBRE01_3368 [Enteropsectra breve]